MKKFVVASPENIEHVGMKIFNELSKYIFECCTDLDLAALYPSIIRALNISVETCIGKVYFDYNGYSGETLIQDYMANDIINFGNKYLNLPTVEDFVGIIDDMITNGEIEEDIA
jgi:DNA polymerase elongation subunit (family B)